MADVLIRVAESAEDIDRLFRARHRVFAEVDGYVPCRADGRLCDRFDAYPTNRNLIAEHDGRIVGGLRFTEQSPAGTPPDEFFDFGSFLDAKTTRFGSASKLFLEHAYRGSKVAFTLYGVGYAWGLGRGWTHVIGTANPETVPALLRSGYRPLTAEQFHAQQGLPFVPVLLDVAELDPRLRRFASSYRGGPVWCRLDHRPEDEATVARRPAAVPFGAHR
ncbi:MAG TPA: GNAT family N-acyltransferase [Thermomicrobiales bacterium]|jgi:N-acyl-L-homoserine lactone synthetase